MSLRQKIEFLRTVNFGLYVNGEPIWLNTFFGYERDSDFMYHIRFRMFPPHTFALGTYYFPTRLVL